ncbi:zinc-dependent metalloprotease [Tenacibaculum xiamenense]|uniref:zinc-dependent metalloprotease n=1 Tax=Tenacibaculum xiamenense TaxID=1261553 RepID=UPI0038961341
MKYNETGRIRFLPYFLFFLLATSFLSFSQNCGFDEYLGALKSLDPNIENSIKAQIIKIKNKKARNYNNQDDKIITIPVVFNLVHPFHYTLGQGANLRDSDLIRQINDLNDRYSGRYTGIDTKIRFCLAKQNVFGINEEGISHFYGKEFYQPFVRRSNWIQHALEVDADIKQHRKNSFPSDTFLNIWIAELKWVDGSDKLKGYSSSPLPEIHEALPFRDGVVIDYRWVNKATPIHEIGHWLGLLHSYDHNGIASRNPCDEVDCETQGDYICDTETVPRSGDLNVAPGTCKGYNCNNQITSAVQNYMDYQKVERDYCRIFFTEGQKERMRDLLKYVRYTIWNNSYFNLKNFCDTSLGGTGGTNPTNGVYYNYCTRCYEPSISVPLNCYRKRHYPVDYRGDLFVSAVEEPESRSKINIRAYRVDCGELKEVLFYNLNFNSTDHDRVKSVKIINSKTFTVISNDNGVRGLKIFEEIEGDWRVRDINISDLSGQIVTRSGYYITKNYGSPTNKRSIYRFDINTHELSFVTDDFYYDAENIKLTDKGYFKSKQRGLIEEWEYDGIDNRYYKKRTINLPIENWLEDKNVSYYYFDKYIVPVRWSDLHSTNNGFLSIKLYKEENGRWIEEQDLNINTSYYGYPHFINDNYLLLFRKGPNGGHDGIVYFYKREASGKFEQITDLNHLNPNSATHIGGILSSRIEINDELNHVFVGDQILKFSDIFQVSNDELKGSSTTHICNYLEKDVLVSDYNINLGGNTCNISINNRRNDFIAENRIIMSPRTRITGGNVLLTIGRKLDNDCPFPNRCHPDTVGREAVIVDKVVKEDIGKQKDDLISIYPNPSNGIVNIKSSKELVKVVIYDFNGNVIFYQDSNLNTISIHNIGNGIYNMKILTKEDGEYYKKLIVSK